MDTFVMRLTDIHPRDSYYYRSNCLVGLRFTVRSGTLLRSNVDDPDDWFSAWCDVVDDLPDELRSWGREFFFLAIKFEAVKD